MATAHAAPADPEAIAGLSARLQAFYDELPADEQRVFQALVLRAAGAPDVSGYGIFDLPITVNGKTVTLSPSNGGSGTNPNANKTGATIAAQPGGSPSGGTTTVGITIRF